MFCLWANLVEETVAWYCFKNQSNSAFVFISVVEPSGDGCSCTGGTPWVLHCFSLSLQLVSLFLPPPPCHFLLCVHLQASESICMSVRSGRRHLLLSISYLPPGQPGKQKNKHTYTLAKKERVLSVTACAILHLTHIQMTVLWFVFPTSTL